MRLQLGEQLGGLCLNMFGIAERAALFRHPHRAELAGPSENILKQVMVHGAVVLKIQIALRKRLARSRVRDFGFVSVQFVLIAQIELVYENR